MEPHTAPHAFISYAHRDRLRVFDDVRWCEASGHRVWIDRELRSAESWTGQLAQAIGDAAIVLVYVSPASMRSRHVHAEVNLAHERGRTLLPIHLEPTELTDSLSLCLAGVQAIVAHELSPQEYVGRLHDVLTRALRPGEPAAAPPLVRERTRLDLGQLGM